MWNYEGMWVTAKYFGAYPVSGDVVSSRTKLGERIIHYIKLDEDLDACDGKIKYNKGDVIIIDHQTVTRVASRNPNGNYE